jgi:hypothetical protein
MPRLGKTGLNDICTKGLVEHKYSGLNKYEIGTVVVNSVPDP